MAKHIGIVGCSAEGTALCYRTICAAAAERMGPHDHPEISLHAHPLAQYLAAQRAGDWAAVAELMLDSARKLAAAGAELLICPANTVHQAMPIVQPASPLPWLHIAREVLDEARRRGFRRLALLGTRFVMDGPVYRDAAGAGPQLLVPEDEQRANVDRIIYDELVAGRLLPPSRQYLSEVLAHMKARGCDAAVLGCTELPLLVDPEACPLPVLDSTRLLARAAVREALSGEDVDPGCNGAGHFC